MIAAIVNDIAQNLGLAAAICGALTLLVGVGWRVLRFVYSGLKYAEHVHEVVERMDKLLTKELTNNGGSSMLDKIDKIEETVTAHDGRIVKIEAHVFPVQ